VLAVSPEERSELQLEEPHTELAERYVDSHLGIEKGCTEKSRERVLSVFISRYHVFCYSVLRIRDVYPGFEFFHL
jgi:hypothetical protein